MRQELEEFLALMPDSDSLLAKNSEAVAFFGFFLCETLHQPITPATIAQCYEAARLPKPRSVPDTMAKSKAFVRFSGIWTLKRDTSAKIKSKLLQIGSGDTSATSGEIRKTVMVVYGRDEDTRRDMFSFLRSIDLVPIEWNSAIQRTGKATPYVGEILASAFNMAQAFLVLMTPDERASLRPELQKEPNDGDAAYQPRQNVVLEAGMALATNEARTVLVAIGLLRRMSDLDGRHLVRLNNSPERRHDLIERLKVAGCDPHTNGSDWIGTGNFERH